MFGIETETRGKRLPWRILSLNRGEDKPLARKGVLLLLLLPKRIPGVGLGRVQVILLAVPLKFPPWTLPPLLPAVSTEYASLIPKKRASEQGSQITNVAESQTPPRTSG